MLICQNWFLMCVKMHNKGFGLGSGWTISMEKTYFMQDKWGFDVRLAAKHTLWWIYSDHFSHHAQDIGDEVPAITIWVTKNEEIFKFQHFVPTPTILIKIRQYQDLDHFYPVTNQPTISVTVHSRDQSTGTCLHTIFSGHFLQAGHGEWSCGRRRRHKRWGVDHQGNYVLLSTI